MWRQSIHTKTSVPSTQFCCEPKISLKNKVYLQKILNVKLTHWMQQTALILLTLHLVKKLKYYEKINPIKYFNVKRTTTHRSTF